MATATPCEVNVLCQLSKIKTDIAKLYDRTDDINEVLETCCAEDGSTPPTGSGPFRTISTEAELNVALSTGGEWYVIAMVPLTPPIDAFNVKSLVKPNTRLIGLPLNNLPVGFSMAFKPGNQLDGNFGWDMFHVHAKDCLFHNLSLTCNHPLISNMESICAAIGFYAHPDIHIAEGLVIDSCDIYNVGIGIHHGGARAETGFEDHPRIRITNNRIHAFCNSGIQINWQCRDLLIDNNIIRGRDPGQTHSTIANNVGTAAGSFYGNAIFVGNSIEKVIISRNNVGYIDRHGIEVFNEATGDTRQVQVINNFVNDCSFGISCTGNDSILIHGNSILRAKQIGIEVVGFRAGASWQEIIISNNWIKDITPIPPPFQTLATQSQGIAVTCVDRPTLICDNQIHNILSPNTAPVGSTIAYLDAMGIQLYGVMKPAGVEVLVGVKYTTIRGNRFTDAGNKMIWLNGHSDGDVNQEDRFDAVNIEANTFSYSRDYESIYDGKVGTENNYSSIFISAPLGAISVRNNVTFFDEEHPEYGTYKFLGVGTVYSGGAADAPVVQDAEGSSDIEGSNIRIPYTLPPAPAAPIPPDVGPTP